MRTTAALAANTAASCARSAVVQLKGTLSHMQRTILLCSARKSHAEQAAAQAALAASASSMRTVASVTASMAAREAAISAAATVEAMEETLDMEVFDSHDHLMSQRMRLKFRDLAQRCR